MSGLLEALTGVVQVGIDSSPFIYLIEAHPLYLPYEQYLRLLLTNSNLDVVTVDVQVAQAAAELRAKSGVRLPDAIQVAAAMVTKCEAFVTNDRSLKQITAIQVLVLDDLLGSNK